MPSDRQPDRTRRITESIQEAIRDYLRSVDGQIKSARRAIRRCDSRCECSQTISTELQCIRYLQQRGQVLTSVHHDDLETAGASSMLRAIGSAQLQMALFIDEVEEITDAL